jgi:hypothetical protein
MVQSPGDVLHKYKLQLHEICLHQYNQQLHDKLDRHYNLIFQFNMIQPTFKFVGCPRSLNKFLPAVKRVGNSVI